MHYQGRLVVFHYGTAFFIFLLALVKGHSVRLIHRIDAPYPKIS